MNLRYASVCEVYNDVVCIEMWNLSLVRHWL